MQSNQAKKKPRQRNRSRNKANRSKSLVDNKIQQDITKKENSFETMLVNEKEEDNAQEECTNDDDMPELIDENDILQENLDNRIIEALLSNQTVNISLENDQDTQFKNLSQRKLETKQADDNENGQLKSASHGITSSKMMPDNNENLYTKSVEVESDKQSKQNQSVEKTLIFHDKDEISFMNEKAIYDGSDHDYKTAKQDHLQKSKTDSKLKEQNSIQSKLSLQNRYGKQTINLNDNAFQNEENREAIEDIVTDDHNNNDDDDVVPELIDERLENVDKREDFDIKETVQIIKNGAIKKKLKSMERKSTSEKCLTLKKCHKKTKTDLELKRENTEKLLQSNTSTMARSQEENPVNIKQKTEESTNETVNVNTIKERKPTLGEIKLTNCNLDVVDFIEKPPIPQQQNSIQNNVKLIEKSCHKLQKPDTNEKNAFIQNLQQQMEAMMAKGNDELPTTLMENLQKLFNQTPINDIETSDEEDEYVEYIYKPRKYFLISLCNYCKIDLCLTEGRTICKRCHLTYYCCKDHMKKDIDHRQLCYAIKRLSENNGADHIFYNCSVFTPEQFRSYRIVTIKQLEAYINRPLIPSEQEIILFPRLCFNNQCRECRFEKLKDCQICGMVAFCTNAGENYCQTFESKAKHENWCKAYQLFKQFIIHQERFGRLEPSMPSKVLKEFPIMCTKTKDIFKRLNLDLPEGNCEYAALTQISTVPLTAWYALKVCDKLKSQTTLTIHLIGAEIEFEIDLLHKWELFFLHITPALQQLNVIFIGPELDPKNISFDQLSKTKCCRLCRKSERSVKYRFIREVYHDYCKMDEFLNPHLICFFNAGLYRSFGYNMEDTWPETISAASQLKVPVIVSAYTEYEMPLDMQRFLQESNRRLNIIMPPHLNPFQSVKPERNFISDDVAPLMFKNYYCFVVE